MASSTTLLALSISFVLSAAASSLPFASAASEPPQPPQMPRSTAAAAAAAFLAPILSNLGYKELSMAVSSLGSPAFLSPWSAPVTLFAPSDDSIRLCGGGPICSPARLLKEHLVLGVFPAVSLSKLTFGTKLQTASPNRCLTVTSAAAGYNSNSTTKKIFVDGVEVTRPDLFNDGKIVIHGIPSFVAPLSPFSCIDSHRSDPPKIPGSGAFASAEMMWDAIVRLWSGGYSILGLAMWIKSPELAGLENMTLFTLDDQSILAGGHAYVTEVRFHVVPNQLLSHSDLVNLPEGTVLPTLVRGQHLLVTQSGVSGPFGSGLRINYAPIKNPDVVYNGKIAVHSLFFPFPHLYLADQQAYSSPLVDSAAEGTLEGTSDAAFCSVLGNPGDCKIAVTPTPEPAPSPTLNW